jgi:hypothetical protein
MQLRACVDSRRFFVDNQPENRCIYSPTEISHTVLHTLHLIADELVELY